MNCATKTAAVGPFCQITPKGGAGGSTTMTAGDRDKQDALPS